MLTVSRLNDFLIVSIVARILNYLVYYLFYGSIEPLSGTTGSTLMIFTFTFLTYYYHTDEYKDDVKEKISFSEFELSNVDRLTLIYRIIIPIVVNQGFYLANIW